MNHTRISFFMLMLLLCIARTLLAQTQTFFLYFENDMSEPLQDSTSAWQEKWLEFSKGKTITAIRITAYCDDKGSISYNQNLSEQRAQFVKSILLSSNVKEEWIQQCDGKGELELKSTQDVDGQRQKNRRAEIFVTFQIEQQKPKKGFDKNLKVGDKITFDNILFIGGRHYLLEESYSTLDSLVSKLNASPEYHIAIHGHVCCQTNGKDGLDHDTGMDNLSVARAKAIYDYLIQNGISETRLTYKGHGSKFPLGKGDKYDRRVEFEITSIGNN